jgi:hypothetical protein
MNSLDRSLRLFVAAVLTILYFTNILTGLVGSIFLVVAGYRLSKFKVRVYKRMPFGEWH